MCEDVSSEPKYLILKFVYFVDSLTGTDHRSTRSVNPADAYILCVDACYANRLIYVVDGVDHISALIVVK